MTGRLRLRTAPAALPAPGGWGVHLRRALGSGLAALALGAATACGSDPGAAEGDGGAVLGDTAPPASAEGDASGVGTDTSPAPATPVPPPDGGTGPVLVLQDAEVEVEDQSGDGTSVVVAEVELPDQPGFVAVHRDEGGRLGDALGSAPVPSGGAGDLRVELDTPVPETGPVTVVLHVDDGDEAFDPLVDPQVLDDDGDLESDTATYTVT